MGTGETDHFLVGDRLSRNGSGGKSGIISGFGEHEGTHPGLTGCGGRKTMALDRYTRRAGTAGPVNISGNRNRGRASNFVMEAAVRRGETTIEREDADLVREVQAGVAEAFAPLVRRYQDRVFNACLRICRRAEDAEDAAQEVFLRAFAKIGSYKGDSGLYTWLFRIAVNVSLTQRKRARLRLVGSLNGDERGGAAERVPDERGPGPESLADQREMQERVAAALATLDDQQRVILVLRDIEGCDYAQISRIMDVPVGTVKSRVHRARAALRGVIERMQPGLVCGRRLCPPHGHGSEAT